jgi:hypothetical protein
MTDLPAASYFTAVGRKNLEAKTAQNAMLAFLKQLPGGAALTALTISSGAVTPTSGFCTVDTEAAAASDDLANVLQTNLPDGSTIVLASADASRVVTVKHGAGGAGQVLLATSADLVLSNPTQTLFLQRRGTTWVEVDRSYGSNLSAARTFLGALASSGGTLTGALNEAQGSDVASAATVNLTTATGNLVDVTGNTTITAITLAQGAERWVRFTGTPLLTHGASLVLPGAANLRLAAGDFACFRGYGSSVVRLTGFIRASSLPAFLAEAQAWTKPQRLQNSVALTGQSGSVTLDMATYTDFSITQTGIITSLANPTIAASMVGQRGVIRVAGNAYGITGMGSYWKRVGSTGTPTVAATGFTDLDYHIVATDRIRFSVADEEA